MISKIRKCYHCSTTTLNQDYIFSSTMGCTCKRVFFITGLIIMELIDLGLDWDFFVEVNKTDQEKIQSETELKYLILAFAVVGTLTFILQLVAIYYDSKQNYSHLTYSITMSFISTWLEDIPQIILAIWVASISSDLISYVQYAKASYAILEALLHFGVTIWQLCCKKEKFKYKKNSDCLMALLVLDLIGGILLLGASVFLLIELRFDKYY
ncbi:unnamed protein product [Mytilus edulis]|uniref:Uncharacterized protein n=1 Tax=Mytilus edulis TaxID=6550 RepID=A0A8S3R637_MYTED|nr:unnamed protein product [Mytilus edulis]